MRNPTAARVKQTAVPAIPMISPAIAGDIVRVNGQIDEFNATALIMSFRSMSCGKSARRAGWSKASTPPAKKEMINRCQMLTISKKVTVARMTIREAVIVWVT